jgi:hypothetical protein
MTERPLCAEIRELILDIAAGVVAGDERAQALGHLGTCADCRRELAETSDVLDGLMLLAPEREPPAGFENAVLARLAPPRPHRLRTAARRALVLAAVAAIAASAVWWRTADDRHLAAGYRHALHIAHGTDFRTAGLVQRGAGEIATVFAYEGHPTFVYATFRTPPAPGHYDVRMTLKDGRAFWLNPLDAEDETHGWGSRIQVPVHIRDIRSIDFLKSNAWVMTAPFN